MPSVKSLNLCNVPPPPHGTEFAAAPPVPHTEKRLKIRWTRTLVVSLCLFASRVNAASQIGTTTATDALSSASRFFTHSANGYYWVAYHNGTEPVLASSRDGITWASQGQILSSFDPLSSGMWAVRYSGKNVIVFATKDAGSHTRYYRNGTLNSNGTVTWNAADQDTTAQGNSWQETNALIAGTKPIMFFVGPFSGSWGNERIGNQLNTPTFSDPSPTPPSLTSVSASGAFSAGAMFQTGGDDPYDYIVLRAATTTPYSAGNHRLAAVRFDASVPIYVSNTDWYNVSLLGVGAGPYQLTESADTEVKEGTDGQAHTRFAAVRDTSGNIHAVYINRNDNVVHYKKVVGFDDNWSRLSTDVTQSTSAIDRVALASAGTNNLFLFYSKSDGKIYYRRYNNSSWESEGTIKTTTTTLRGALAPMESADGCQIGIAWVEGSGSPYNVMFSLGVGDCTELRTASASGKITVETPEVKMVWDSGTDGGGGLAEVYAKTETNSSVNRSGSVIGYNVFSTQVEDGTWYFEMNTGTLQLLEATSTRVKMRQKYDYTGANHVERDWTAYGYPRVTIRETLTFDTTTNRRGATGLNGNADTFFNQGQSNSTDKVWIVTDDASTYSDMLAVPYTTPFFGRSGASPSWMDQYENNAPEPPNTWIARIHENAVISTSAQTDTRSYLLYPYLAGLTSSGTEWQPYANDYRSPDGLSISVGSAWSDSAENTASDDFNEAEGSYNLTFDPASGLTFQLDGFTTTRRKPFFKIRHWRSLQDPSSITLAGTTLANDIDYRTDVKPFSRGRFCTGTCTELANGGLTSDSNEYLADPSRNSTLTFTGTNKLYLGSDAKFRGVNVALSTKGTGSADLLWEYWNGSTWVNLETAGVGFTDQTTSLTKDGTLYWTSDPSNWATRVDITGDPALYYVRASLFSGSYTQNPIEGLIKTDILLLQYCGDVSSDAQAFSVPVPTPTAVELVSFEAEGRDGAVALSWETASELHNLGFNLYRATEREGAYEPITAAAIPGLGSSPVGARYGYTDSGLVNGQTYFYKLEDIDTRGRTKRHGPVSASPSAEAPIAPQPTTPPAPAGGSWIKYGDPEAVSFRVLEESRTGILVELRLGGFYAEPLGDGSVRLHVPGLWDPTEESVPALPQFRTWLPTKWGSASIRSVLPVAVESFSSLRPSFTEAHEAIATRSGTVKLEGRRASRHFVATAGLYPENVARIAGEGFQGDVRKALLEIAPLRWSTRRRELLFARQLRVRLALSPDSRVERHRENRSHRRTAVTRRLTVRKRGLYAVRFEALWGPRQASVEASGLRLSRQGEPVPFHLEPDPEVFAPGSTLYFVSGGADLNPYGTEAVYEISREPGKRMAEVDAPPSGSPVHFVWSRIDKEENHLYQAGLLSAQDRWFWDVLFAPVGKSYPFEIEGLAGTTEPAQLELLLQGTSDLAANPDHHVRVFVNGSLIAQQAWDGMQSALVRAEIAPGILREGANRLEVENAGDTGASYSMVMLNRYAVTFPRTLRTTSGTLEGRFSVDGTVRLEGPVQGASVLDVTGGSPRWLRGVESSSGSLRFHAVAGHVYLAVSPNDVLTPTVATPTASRLKSALNAADYVVIGPRALLPEARPLLELRQSQGLRTRAVPIDEVYSEFGFGEPRPEAIRDFIAYAYHHWRRRPRYVLLLGDGTYDFKDYLETGVRNGVPPFITKTSYLWTASDPKYATVNGEDPLPDLAIGRLPAQNASEARAMVQKILSYESSPSLDQGAVVLIADDADEAGNFESDAETLASGVLAAKSPERIYRIYLGRLGVDGTRAAIAGAFDRGASLMSYIGHGGIHLWAHENVFNIGTVSALSRQDAQPIVLTLNCLNGYFHFPYFNSLAEALVKAPGKGALAAISPSGLSLNEPAQKFHRALLEEMLSLRHRRLGDAFLAAQATYAETGALPELVQVYHLFGDPALKLR